MFVNVYHNVVFARAPISTKVESYLVHNWHKNPRLQIPKNFSMMYVKNQLVPLLHHDFEQN
jgi:hypothetical protein